VQAVLAEHGQNLPIEVPDPDRSTIGGLIATALSGPRRFGAGTLRDLLIGISAAHPSGTVTKAGGMVVKNVTGFDLMRLYLGSLGTLGVIVSANFKVLPIARREATIIAEFEDFARAMEAAACIKASRVFPVAIELFRGTEDPWRLAVRIEGRDATVQLLADETQRILARESTIADARESADWWRSYVREQALMVSDREALLRLSTAPSQTATTVSAAISAIEQLDATINRIAVSPGLGSALIWVGFPNVDAENPLAKLQMAILPNTGNVVTLSADPTLKRGIDVWGRVPETIDVMRSIKEQFDPARVLNPGRFAGHL
jgi:glycolate oxidase FAD binding subunit